MGSDLKALLRLQGFSPLKAERWSNFVQHVLAVFRSAAEELRRPENWEKFKRKQGALGAPRERKRQKAIVRAPIEDAITSELILYVRDAYRMIPPRHFLRENNVHFVAEHPVPSDIRAGRYSLKADFFVSMAASQNEPELTIEAKPLRSKADIKRLYLADKGIGCFLEEEPYTDQPLGAMLSYTISDGGQSLRAEVRTALSAYQPKALHLADAMISGEPAPIPLSRHERRKPGLNPISILHLEMIFAPDIQVSAGDPAAR